MARIDVGTRVRITGLRLPVGIYDTGIVTANKDSGRPQIVSFAGMSVGERRTEIGFSRPVDTQGGGAAAFWPEH